LAGDPAARPPRKYKNWTNNPSTDTGDEGAENNHQHPRPGVTDMYDLTLSADDRGAFDWVGDRYNSGKAADLLTDCLPEGREWGDDGEITFDIPEHVAWQINELAEEEGYSWACFAEKLAEKLNELCRSIV
jgi:hypothetical protein